MGPMLAITATSLRRFLRDKSNYFFVFVFPLLLVILIGITFSDEGASGQVVVVGDSALAQDLTSTLEEANLTVASAPSADEARDDVARGRADAFALVDASDQQAFADGSPVDIEVVAGSSTSSTAARQAIQSAVATLDLSRTTQAVLVDAGVASGDAQRDLRAAKGAGPSLVMSVAGDDSLDEAFAGLGQFDLGAAQQLSLFVFLASLAGASSLIQSRQLGVTRRELAAPITTGQVIAGEALGRFAVAMTQGVYIVVGTAVLFDVDWGNMVASIVVLALFCAVSAAAAMVLGALLDNDNLAGGVGVGVGLVMAALGGSMLPLELFPDGLLRVSAVTPHHWAYEAYAEIMRRGGGVTDVLPQLGALLGMTVLLLPLGAWLLRRSLGRAL